MEEQRDDIWVKALFRDELLGDLRDLIIRQIGLLELSCVEKNLRCRAKTYEVEFYLFVFLPQQPERRCDLLSI